MGGAADGADILEHVGQVLNSHARDVERVARLLEEIRSEEALSLAGISVAVRELAVFADRLEA